MAALSELAHIRCLAFVAKSGIENLHCSQVQWLQSVLCCWNWSLPKPIHGSWAKTKALGPSGTAGCPEYLKLVLAHLVWLLHSCHCWLHYRPWSHGVAQSTPLNMLDILLQTHRGKLFTVPLGGSFLLRLCLSPLLSGTPHLISLTSLGSRDCCSRGPVRVPPYDERTQEAL